MRTNDDSISRLKSGLQKKSTFLILLRIKTEYRHQSQNQALMLVVEAVVEPD